MCLNFRFCRGPLAVFHCQPDGAKSFNVSCVRAWVDVRVCKRETFFFLTCIGSMQTQFAVNKKTKQNTIYSDFIRVKQQQSGNKTSFNIKNEIILI